MRRYVRRWTRLAKVVAFGAPIYVHWSLFVAVVLLAFLSFGSPVYAALAIASYLAIITIHELGHAYAARRLGLDVDAIRIAVFHGQCEISAPDNEWDAVLVAWAGIAAQVAVALIVFVIAPVVDDREPGYFGPVYVFLGYVNLMFAAVNLAPGQGLDGSVAWRIVPLAVRHWRARRAAGKALRVVGRRK